MFKLQNPIWLILLLSIPAALYFYFIKPKVRASSLNYPDLSWYAKIHNSYFNRRALLVFLRLLILTLLIAALARPQTGQSSRDAESQGIDILLALDISGSMQAEDFKPHNRLYAAKEVIKDFIRDRRSDRIGLVIFASESVTQCPLTTDYSVLASFVDQVEIGQIVDGTAIGLGLASSINRLRHSESKSRIVILLTDGNNNAGEIDPLTAAELAQIMGIKVYTIGAGKPGQATFTAADPATGRRVTYRLPELQEDILKQIAYKTGGEYFRATDEKALLNIYKTIDQLEKTKVKVKQYTQYADLFPYFLWAGLALLLLEILAGNTVLRKLP
ncbi:MAG: VWA domain-containing protein [candidate division Zixibacteria bacterium]|nr:VWA domain-containing protein [candidate division Zixibacteria bacterium]